MHLFECKWLSFDLRHHDERSRPQPGTVPSTHKHQPPELERGVGLWGAISANVLNMVGIGPFLTIPLALAAMGGPQAMLGWILGALIALCDGLVWAELGSAMPQSGGPYHYLLEAFGPRSLGRLAQFSFSLADTYSWDRFRLLREQWALCSMRSISFHRFMAGNSRCLPPPFACSIRHFFCAKFARSVDSL